MTPTKMKSKLGLEKTDQHRTEVKENIVDTKLSPSSKWHDKCIAGYDLDEKKKKTKKQEKCPDEVVRFVEGVDSELTSPKKGDVARKNSKYNTQVKFLEHKYVQCNIVKNSEDVEVSLPEDIKPLLVNVTFLLHELKQLPKGKNQEDLSKAITNILMLLTELSRRPITVSDGLPKPFDEVGNKLEAILNEQNGPGEEEYEKLLQEIKYLEEELTQKDSEVKYVKEQIEEEKARLMSNSTSVEDSLRNSVLKNQTLKAEIKFNKMQCRKYVKTLSQKEQSKQKYLIELNNLKRKLAKLELNLGEGHKPAYLRLSQGENDVSHGGTLTKYTKSKVVKKKTSKNKITKGKRRSTASTRIEK